MSPAEAIYVNTALGIVREYAPQAVGSTPIGELGLDSLEYLALIVDLEKAFETKIDDFQLRHIDTVHDLVAAVSA